MSLAFPLRQRVRDIFAGTATPIDRSGLCRLAALVVVGGLAGYIIVPNSHHVASRAAPCIVTLDGKPIPLDGDTRASIDSARATLRAFVNEEVTLTAAGASKKITREELGAHIDTDRLAALIDEARDARSPLRRAHDQVAAGQALKLPLPIDVDVKRATSALLQVKDELDKAPVDAKIDVEAHVVRPEEIGRRVDVYATMARLDEAFVRGDDKIDSVVENVPASRTADQLRDVKMDDILGYFETKYARDQKHEARTFNLRLAASKLNGAVVMPGETFDLNATVGPRTEANGYKIAPVIAEGELVDGVGGGTCQIAGTLHGAAFFAGLDIVDRKPHTRPSFYIKMGMDAAVAYPNVTLKVRNPFPFPVVLHETLSEGIVRAEVLGPKRTRDVTFVRKINEVTPFTEKEVPDPKVPRGKRSLAQRGIPGFKITRYRIVRDGPFAVRERTQDVYPATMQIWHVGTGDADPKFLSHDDEHPEYVADEYLMITQGADITSPHSHGQERGGGMLESRVAGKYGTHGWMVREGFAKSVPDEKTE